MKIRSSSASRGFTCLQSSKQDSRLHVTRSRGFTCLQSSKQDSRLTHVVPGAMDQRFWSVAVTDFSGPIAETDGNRFGHIKEREFGIGDDAADAVEGGLTLPFRRSPA